MRRSKVSRTRLLRPSKEIQRDFPDRGFQWLLDSPTCLHTVMRLKRPELLALVDFSRVERRPRLLVPADLSKLENDALYTLPFLSGIPHTDPERPLLGLLEHKAQPDRRAPVQALEYLTPVWSEQAPRRHPGHMEEPHLSPAAVFLIYTGQTPWPDTANLHELIRAPPVLMPGGMPWQWSHLDLARLPPAELYAIGTPMAWAFRLTQVEAGTVAVYAVTLLQEVLPGLEAAPGEAREEVERVLWYVVQHLYHRRSDAEYARLLPQIQDWGKRSKFEFRREIQSMIRSMAKIHQEEGEQRGLQLGEQRGLQLGEQRGLQLGRGEGESALREALVGLLGQRFGEVSGGIRGALDAADLGRLLAWHQRALNAGTLEDVGIATNGTGAQPGQ